MKTLLLSIIIFSFASIAQTFNNTELNRSDSALVAFYPFNGNANDESGNGHDGSISGATITTDRFNKSERAYNFVYNGFSSDRIEVSGTADFNFSSGGFSISAWVKFSGLSSSGNNYPIFSKHICGEQSGYILMLYNGKLTFWLAGSVGYNILSTPSDYTDNNWHHVVAVYDGVTQSIYVDGLLKNSISFSYNIFNSANWALGGYNGCNGGFNGKVDEIIVLNRALSGSEILDMCNQSANHLVAFYPFNGNANDESGNANNPTFIGSGVTLTTDRFGNSDKAYYFDGNIDSYIRIPADNFPTTDRTISFWFNADQIENHPTPLSYGGDVCHNSVLMIINKGDYPNAYTVLSHCASNFISAPYSSPPINNWYYLTMTISGTTQKIFINGVLQQAANTFTTPTVVTGKSAIFGAILYTDGNTVYVEPTAGEFQGKLDDFRFYNTAMTDLEVQNLYNSEANGLVAFYPFNGNAIDESGNGHDGIVIGGVLAYDRNGNANSAYTFPNSPDQIVLSNSTDLNLLGGFTLNAWIKYKNLDSHIISKHNCYTTNSFAFVIYGGQIELFLGDGGGWNTLATNETFTENQWYMVSAVYDSVNGTASIFINGQLKVSGSVNYNTPNTAPITISGATGSCPAINMSGAVDEVKIFNRPLSGEEIQTEYNLSHTGLVAFYPFNGNANDESGNGNNGTLSGATLTQDRFGVENSAYSLNVPGDFITIADNPNLFSDDLTISWWYKLSEVPGGAWVVIGWVDGGHRYQQFFSGGQLSYLNGYNVAQPGTYFNPIYGLNDLNVWKNVVVTYKKLGETTSTSSIYVDGELKQTDNHTLAMDYVPGIDLFIGKNHNGNYFKGQLDDFRIYNRVLSSDEVVELFNDSTTYNPPLEDGLVAYWPFDSNTDDSTNNNNDGINYNGTFSKDRYGTDSASMFFNGVDSYVEGINPGNNLPVGNSPRTFSAWVKNYEYNQYGSNIFHYGTQQAAPTNIHFLTTDVLGLGNGYGYGVVYGNTNLIDSTWHLVTGVYEGGTERITKLFVDGKIDNTGTISTEPNTIPGTNWRMGRFMEGGTPFKGNIDELKVFNIALSDQNVWDIYKATTTAPTLLSPANDSTVINSYTPLLDWDSTVTAQNYRIQISTDSTFQSTLLDTLLSISFYQVEGLLLYVGDHFYWKIRTMNSGGIGPWSEFFHFDILFTSVEDEQQLPTEFALLQNYPNPFNPSTIISYELPKTSNVVIKVYDVLGNEIATLVDEEKSAGRYSTEFFGSNLSSGIYLYKITSGDFIKTKKMILIK